jgi:sulfhydrogenase subunit delta
VKYLCFDVQKPRIAVFDFTSCEGCELQLANKEETLLEFLSAVEVVDFREISSLRGAEYEIALVEGSITRGDEIERLKAIRRQARVLVALGSCACFGGVNRLRNAYPLEEANREVYGDLPKESLQVMSLGEVVPIDLEIPGCPVNKDEVERAVQHLLFGIPFRMPVYPVCLECKQRFVVCMFERGQLCLGPVTRGGCNAPCPAGGLGCWGCRGTAVAANLEEFLSIARGRGFGEDEIFERLDFFGAFRGVSRSP